MYCCTVLPLLTISFLDWYNFLICRLLFIIIKKREIGTKTNKTLNQIVYSFFDNQNVLLYYALRSLSSVYNGTIDIMYFVLSYNFIAFLIFFSRLRICVAWIILCRPFFFLSQNTRKPRSEESNSRRT